MFIIEPGYHDVLCIINKHCTLTKEVCLYWAEFDTHHTGIVFVSTCAPVIGELWSFVGGIPQQDSLSAGDELIFVPVMSDARHNCLRGGRKY